MRVTDARRILAYSVEQVLEMMCFSEAQPVSEPFEESRVIATRINFWGNLTGCLRIEISGDTANWLAVSFLGIHDAALEPSMAEDTVCELGNVICGRFLSLLDPSANLRIDAPRKQEPSNSGEIAWQHFRADSGLLRVAFEFNSTDEDECR